MKVHIVRGAAAFRFVCACITEHHRHHDPPVGWKWGYIVTRNRRVTAVAVVGRAVGRWANPTLEVTRVCTWSRRRYGAASAIYVAAATDAAISGHPIITYTLAVEPGTSLRAAGWIVDKQLRARRWTCPSRPRRARRDESEPKLRWVPDPWRGR